MISETLKKIVPTCPYKLITLYAPFIDAAMKEFDINTPLRQAAFIAQVAHETMGLNKLNELWGPTPQQLKYDTSIRLMNQLGNKQLGDGFKYRGRGGLHITGLGNYTKYGKALGVDLVNHPELAESQVFAFRIAGLFWKDHGLNELADKLVNDPEYKNFEQITSKINGSYTAPTSHYPERLAYLKKAKEVLHA